MVYTGCFSSPILPLCPSLCCRTLASCSSHLLADADFIKCLLRCHLLQMLSLTTLYKRSVFPVTFYLSIEITSMKICFLIKLITSRQILFFVYCLCSLSAYKFHEVTNLSLLLITVFPVHVTVPGTELTVCSINK